MTKPMNPMYVRGVGIWTFLTPTTPAWLAPYTHPADAKPDALLLPARVRGRASLLTRMFADVVAQATQSCDAAARSELAMVLGSGNGELQVTAELLAMMHDTESSSSPLRFQNSVHNTAAGQLSIACGQRGFGSSIAAGPATAAACFEEAASYLALFGGQLLLAIGDEASPAFLAQRMPCQPLALAVLLASTPGPASADHVLALRMCTDPPNPPVDDTQSTGVFPNPCSAALPLWRALVERRSARVLLGREWNCSIDVSAEPSS